LGSDTLFLCLQDYTGEYKDFDSFVNSAPYYWKKYNRKIGGYGVVIYGKGRKNFNESLNDINLGQWKKIIITGDPIVNSIYLNY
jgi:hypothetical protein